MEADRLRFDDYPSHLRVDHNAIGRCLDQRDPGFFAAIRLPTLSE